MGLGPGFAVLKTLGRDDPGFALKVDLGPSGADHFAGPQPRQQRDFEGSGGNSLPLAEGGQKPGRLLVIEGTSAEPDGSRS